VTHFSGQQDLGKLAGGVYHTTGWADGRTFQANFQADKDFGTYQMTRVGSDADCADSCTDSCAGSCAGSCAATTATVNP
jgi:hypothetical protein